MNYVKMPEQLKGEMDEEQGGIYVTLLIPEESPLPTIADQWEHNDGGLVRAWYTRTQLMEAVLVGLEIKFSQLEKRLDRGEQMLDEAHEAGNEERVEELLQHYKSLLQDAARAFDVREEIRLLFRSQ